MNRRRRMLSSSSVGKKESHCSAKLCTPVWFSIDSKGHLQARKKGKAEKLLKNCGKIAINCRKLRKIAKNCEFAENCGKLRTSIPPHPAGWLLGWLRLIPGGCWAQWKCACQESSKRHLEKWLQTFKIPPRHKLVHFCCAKFCHCKFCLFLIFPSPVVHIAHDMLKYQCIVFATCRIGSNTAL